jgi:hypothetical protein
MNKGKRTGQPLQEHVVPHEQLEPQLQPPLDAHPQSEPGMLEAVLFGGELMAKMSSIRPK